MNVRKRKKRVKPQLYSGYETFTPKIDGPLLVPAPMSYEDAMRANGLDPVAQVWVGTVSASQEPIPGTFLIKL